jgi:glycosyltransferase involved in cell wall biosynthesis
MLSANSEESSPLVSIVTPVYNAAPFIRRTIESVLSQDYPRIEYIVMDAGSTDGTIEILKSYGARLNYVSEPDQGAADAINRGFLRSVGKIFAWLNADDVYLPGAVTTVARYLNGSPQSGVVYGGGIWVDENDAVLGRYPTQSPYSAAALEHECFICQPAAFMTRTAFESVGLLNPKLMCSFDYDLWIRVSRTYPFLALSETLATSRMHSQNKSLKQRAAVFQETIALLQQHFGYVPLNWVYGYLSYLRDGRDQYFEPLRHSPLIYLESLLVGSYYNWRQAVRFWQEWAGCLTIRNLSRMRRGALQGSPIADSARLPRR